MSLNLRWVNPDEYDRVGETRLYCYGHATKNLETFQANLKDNPRVQPGDCLLAERNGRAVGTATALSLKMWVRGGAVPCQGVAWVGTIKTARRGSTGPIAGEASGKAGGQAGIATQIMHETIRLAREREQVVSALMPFRGSFYEHFGYGIMERRNTWTVPIANFPHGSSEGLRFFEPNDLPELVACRQRIAQAGQCDMERTTEVWEWTLKHGTDGMMVVDRPDNNGPIHGWMKLEHVHLLDGTDTMDVDEAGYEDLAALKRQLHFLGSLRDQYTRAILTLPADVQLNRLLREPQLTHRDNRNHPTPECRPHTRMQLRILDHKRFIEAMHLPADMRGAVAVTIHETEGHTSRLWIDLSDGHARVSPTEGTASFECRDTTWAAIVTGDLSASEAVRLGLATATDTVSAALLDIFSRGPAPFTHEYF